MTRRCTICDNAARAAIEAALVAGETQTDTAKRFDVPRRALGRHRVNHMTSPISIIKEGKMPPLELTGKTDEERIEALWERLEYLVNEADNEGASMDQRIRLQGEIRQTIETLARCKGKIADTMITVQLLNVIVTDGNGNEASTTDSEPVQLLLESGED